MFYNISDCTLQRLDDKATNNQNILLANVTDYPNGFIANVTEIFEKFKLKEQVKHMASKDVLLKVLEKFTAPILTLPPLNAPTLTAAKCRPSAIWARAICLKNIYTSLMRRTTKKPANTLPQVR